MKFKSSEHFELVFRQINKLYEHKNRTSPREVRRKQAEYTLLKALIKKMSVGFDADYKFSRKELRALQSLCVSGRQLLNQMLIPGYEDRIAKEEKPEIKNKYEEYIKKAKHSDTLYAENLIEIERNL